ncbi:MAG: four helix bundle protein [Alphaproteobacteria bacterium]|nr:four helix bundle protein [Alphaproteobacteria bacterium]
MFEQKMAQYKHLPIYKGTYDLLLRVMVATKDFPREYKYTLGQKLKDEVMDLVLYIYRANNAPDKAVYIGTILERIQIIEVMLRLSHDMHVLTRGHYAGMAEMTDSLARQAQGWLKSSGRRKPE